MPNCAAVSDGRKLVVRTVADIKAGEQVLYQNISVLLINGNVLVARK